MMAELIAFLRDNSSWIVAVAFGAVVSAYGLRLQWRSYNRRYERTWMGEDDALEELSRSERDPARASPGDELIKLEAEDRPRDLAQRLPAEIERLEDERRRQDIENVLRRLESEPQRPARDEPESVGLNVPEESIPYSRDLLGSAPASATPTPSSPRIGHRKPEQPRKEATPPWLIEHGTDAEVDVWFATNRYLKPAQTTPVFTGKRGGVVRLGKCTVLVPRFHRIGEVGRSFWRRNPVKDDRLRTRELVVLEEESFWSQLLGSCPQLKADERADLIFIHGYNVSLNEALIRTAQLGVDLAVRGSLTCLSWPSRGWPWFYGADGAAVDASVDFMSEFLQQYGARSGANRINVVAHSMGNRGLLNALVRTVQSAAQQARIPLGQIVLAAPDVDRDVFQTLASVYPSVSQRATMYVSEGDRPLRFSSLLRSYPRAGFAPPITVVTGIDTVSVTKVNFSKLGHGYYAAARPVLADMKQLIESNTPPHSRHGLRRAGNGVYWEMAR